ncbi:MAG: helix-turn-helix domain-containing protein [Solirubrobacteraceae bacterium]
MKPIERVEARRLREQGLSVKAIATTLGVSPSSASRWTADIVLASELADDLRLRNPAVTGHPAGARARSLKSRAARAAAQHAGREIARRGDPLHQTGCMLYWAEGSKSRNTVALTNSDADMLVLFVRFLRECYAVADERMTLTVNCHLNNGLSLDEIERWWLARTGLPPGCLRKSAVNRLSPASRWRRNIHPYGTARVAVHSTAIVQSIYGAIQEYAGIERPEWLDCRIPSRSPP